VSTRARLLRPFSTCFMHISNLSASPSHSRSLFTAVIRPPLRKVRAKSANAPIRSLRNDSYCDNSRSSITIISELARKASFVNHGTDGVMLQTGKVGQICHIHRCESHKKYKHRKWRGTGIILPQASVVVKQISMVTVFGHDSKTTTECEPRSLRCRSWG
jgi:hypothetical protein